MISHADWEWIEARAEGLYVIHRNSRRGAGGQGIFREDGVAYWYAVAAQERIAPQPQGLDAATLAKRLDKVLACHADSMPAEAYHEIEAVRRGLNAAPQPQAEPDGVVDKVIDEMLVCARSCDPDWEGQLRGWAAMLYFAAPQPQASAQASAEDVRAVDACMRSRNAEWVTQYRAWMRIEADMNRMLGVGRE